MKTVSDLRIAVFEGDGIGPEVVQSACEVMRAVLDCIGTGVHMMHQSIGFTSLASEGTTFPSEALQVARAADGLILGPVSHLEYPKVSDRGVNPSAVLRRELDLYANIRPAKTFEGVPRLSRAPFDLVIVRENTEGFYADRTMYQGSGEVMPTADLAMSYRKITRAGSLRIARRAFELAETRGRSLTAVHKSNVLRVTDGLFLECTRQVAEDFPHVEYREELVDAMAALLIRDPTQFDVVVTTNMFGDILSDEATELSGSIGLAASLNLGDQFAMAQAQHGSAPALAGQDIANPASLIGSAAMLLKWLGEQRGETTLQTAGLAVEEAVTAAVVNPASRTRDLGGELGTRAFTEEVVKQVRERLTS